MESQKKQERENGKRYKALLPGDVVTIGDK